LLYLALFQAYFDNVVIFTSLGATFRNVVVFFKEADTAFLSLCVCVCVCVCVCALRTDRTVRPSFRFASAASAAQRYLPVSQSPSSSRRVRTTSIDVLGSPSRTHSGAPALDTLRPVFSPRFESGSWGGGQN
jgi:hypothetical protein